ncbi:MAG: pyruvate kinase alpha/beta domain-containing protein [Dissulfurimicrobium sp.]|uniref:pyruvate kinase alpha/beta domain-containing protein n=1 Tax=Dissulfurimicrobium sp. TaxID=2022436 RepID=UPI004049ACD4
MSEFKHAGHVNTSQTIEILKESVKKYHINQVVVASTFGDTGLAVAREFTRELDGHILNLVVVTHNTGFREPGQIEMSVERRREIEDLGAKVYTGTMAFRNIGAAIRGKQGYSQEDLIANTLRLFGQGVKVCVEIALMASDAGLLTPDDCLAMAGTGRGADTVALIKPMPSNRLFDLKVRAILAKPMEW